MAQYILLSARSLDWTLNIDMDSKRHRSHDSFFSNGIDIAGISLVVKSIKRFPLWLRQAVNIENKIK